MGGLLSGLFVSYNPRVMVFFEGDTKHKTSNHILFKSAIES